MYTGHPNETEFTFTVYPSNSFDASRMADLPIYADITVMANNDAPTLQPGDHFRLTGRACQMLGLRAIG